MMRLNRRVIRSVTDVAAALLGAACSDTSPRATEAPVIPLATAPAELVVSNPSTRSGSLATIVQPAAQASLVTLASGEVAYVSLPLGSIPRAISLTIRNITTAAAETPIIRVINGGFDPVAVPASANDVLELKVVDLARSIEVYRVSVPKRRPPKVVRTSPPRGAIDIALNSRIRIVFTEPVAPTTVNTATVQVLDGTKRIRGTLHGVPESEVSVEFVPDSALASGTIYRLVVTRGVLDADSDSLDAEVVTDFTTATTPVPATALVFSTIGNVGNYACGLQAQTGRAYCWGDGHAGALGIGETVTGDTDRPLLVNGARSYSSISVGDYGNCAIEALTEHAYCWGYNKFGAVGDGTVVTAWEPKQVAGGRIRFASISAGGDVTCGIEARTEVGYCWGKGGLVGDGTLASRSSPTPVGHGSFRLSSISAASDFVCGIEAQTGRAFCWGANQFGQLGDGTTTDRRAPALVAAAGLRFSSIDAAYHVACGVQADTGAGYCWGRNDRGQIGDGTTIDRPVPTPLVGNRRYISIAAGAGACGIEAQTLSAYCWGWNHLGQVGDGTTTDRPVPTLVGGGKTHFKSISTSDYDVWGVESETGVPYYWGWGQLTPIVGWK